MQNMQVSAQERTDAIAYPNIIPLDSLPDASPAGNAEISISCFDNEVPSFIEPVLNQLYGSLFSSMTWFRQYGGLDNTSTFIARRNGNVTAVFLFQIRKRQVYVLNEGLAIDEEAVACFANYIFEHFPSVNIVSFNAVESSIRNLRYPYHQYNCHEDSVISLPATPDDYLDMLGKATRKNIKQYMNRLKRDFPSFQYHVYGGKDAKEEHIRKIINYNRIRFARKERVSGVTPEEEERIIKMIRDCGIVGVITIDGKAVGGSLVYCIGEHYYSWLKAHDPAYDDYRLGLMGTYLMASECISRGGKTLHLMWGREPHKALLGGEHHDYAHVTVFRSGAAVLRHADVLIRHTCQDKMRRSKLKLLEVQKGHGKMANTLRLAIGSLRKIKTVLAQRT